MVLVLRPDGECALASIGWSGVDTVSASWKIKNDKLTISTNGEYTDFYAWLEDDNTTELLLEEDLDGEHAEALFLKIE